MPAPETTNAPRGRGRLAAGSPPKERSDIFRSVWLWWQAGCSRHPDRHRGLARRMAGADAAGGNRRLAELEAPVTQEANNAERERAREPRTRPQDAEWAQERERLKRCQDAERARVTRREDAERARERERVTSRQEARRARDCERIKRWQHAQRAKGQCRCGAPIVPESKSRCWECLERSRRNQAARRGRPVRGRRRRGRPMLGSLGVRR